MILVYIQKIILIKTATAINLAFYTKETVLTFHPQNVIRKIILIMK